MWTTDVFLFLSQRQDCCCDVPSLNYLNWLRISVCKRKFLRMSGNRGFILLVKEQLFWPFLTCENLPSVTVKAKKESQFVAELNTNVFTQTLEGCNYRVNLTFSISRVSITNYRQQLRFRESKEKDFGMIKQDKHLNLTQEKAMTITFQCYFYWPFELG